MASLDPFTCPVFCQLGLVLGPPVLFALQVPVQYPEPPLLPGSSLTFHKGGKENLRLLLTCMLPFVLGLQSGIFFLKMGLGSRAKSFIAENRTKMDF